MEYLGQRTSHALNEFKLIVIAMNIAEFGYIYPLFLSLNSSKGNIPLLYSDE